MNTHRIGPEEIVIFMRALGTNMVTVTLSGGPNGPPLMERLIPL